MTKALLDLTDNKAQAGVAERTRRLFLEVFERRNGHGMLDPGASGDGSQIGFASGGAGITNPRPAVCLVVEDEHDQIFRIEIRQRREIEQREQHATVRFEHDHSSFRQADCETDADADARFPCVLRTEAALGQAQHNQECANDH